MQSRREAKCKTLWAFTEMRSLGGRVGCRHVGATAAQLMGLELQCWGVLGVRLHIADAAAAPNPGKPPVGCAVP